MAIKWKLYYVGGSTWTNEQSKPADIPNRHEVVCIQQWEPILNREILNQWLFYRWVETDGLWFGTSDEGIIDRLLYNKPVLGLLAGVRLSRADFAAFYAVAYNDSDFASLPKYFDTWESPRYGDEGHLS